MRVQEECRTCLERLAKRTAELATLDQAQRDRALNEGLSYLAEKFCFEEIPTRIAGEMQRVIRAVACNKDPFLAIKEKEMKIARELAEQENPGSTDDLMDLIAFAAKGNSLDFFLDLDGLKREIRKPVEFILNDINNLYLLLNEFRNSGKVKKILYLADNAGECYFDLPLVNKLEEFAQVTYVVKEKPVQNDLTLKDLLHSGIQQKFNKVMSTGSDTPGLDLSLVSQDFYKALIGADLLLAKGMGYYETLPELYVPAPVFFLFKAKCAPVARSLNVPLNSYIAYFTEG